MYKLRLIPDNTSYPFMKGRIIGLGMSAFLSVISVILFFYPGLNYGIDFKGGIVIEARLQQPADFPALRTLIEISTSAMRPCSSSAHRTTC